MWRAVAAGATRIGELTGHRTAAHKQLMNDLCQPLQ
jgi:hypothetical protein